MNGNPFYVHPGGEFGPGLQGLAQTMGRMNEQRRKQREMNEIAQRAARIQSGAVEAYRSGDPDKIAEFALANPEIGQALTIAARHRNEKTAQDYTDSLFDVLADPSEENISDIVAKRQELLKREGVGPDDSVDTDTFAERFRTDPEGAKRAVMFEAISRDPQRYKTMRDILQGTEGVEPTANIQDFNYYQTLLRENPTEAAKFAVQVGITPKDKDDRTTAIKEFEYGVRNPKFALKKQREKEEAELKEASEKTFKKSSDLRNEFIKNSKDFQKVRDSYARVLGSTKEPSPAGDLSLIFNYMKMLDPGSVVRESEFATAASAGSYGERIKAAADKIGTGKRLTESMRQDFLSKSKVLYDGMKKQHAKRERTFTDLANRNKLPVSDVVIDISEPAEEDTPISEMTDEQLEAIASGAQ